MALGDSRRDVTVRLRAETTAYKAQMRAAAAETKRAAREAESFDASAGKMGNQVDKLSGRLGIARDALVTIGPAITPIAAVGVPALTGLASQAGFAALAGGTLAVAFQGVGGALKAMNKAQLEPTAENLRAAQVAMAEIAPDAQRFVVRIRELIPALKEVRDAGAEGLFGGGLTNSLDDIESLLPKAERIVGAVAGELGAIAEDSAASLASDRWDDFFTFLETQGPQSLRQLSDALGNTGHAVSELWEAFDPLNDDFGDWLVDATGKLDDAASGLQGSQGLAEFFSYIETTGPQVGATFGAIGNAVVQLVQATAPLGGPVLSIIERLADGFASLADSNLGTPLLLAAAGMATLSRATQLWETVSTKAFGKSQTTLGGFVNGQREAFKQTPNVRTFGNALLFAAHSHDTLAKSAGSSSKIAAQSATQALAARSAVTGWARSIAPTAAGVGALTLATSGLGDKMGISNTLTLGLAGSMAGPLGAGVGAAAGALIDLTSASKGADQALARLNAASGSGNLTQLREAIRSTKDELADIGNVTGFGDAVGDIFKSLGAAVKTGSLKPFADLEQAAFDARAELDSLSGGTEVGSLLTQGLGSGARSAAADVDFLNQSAARLSATLQQLSGNLSLEQSLASTRDAIRGIGEAVAANPIGNKLAKGLGEAGRQGDAVRQALLGAAQQAVQTANQMDAADAKPYLRNMRKSILDVARDLGLPMPQVRRLLAGLGQLDGADANPNVDVKGGRAAVLTFDQIKAAMRTMPRAVRTAVSTPGAIKSVGDVRRLATQYKLTPKQIRTVAQLAGVPLTQGQLRTITRAVKGLNGTKGTAKVAQQGAEKAKGQIDRTLGGVLKFGRSKGTTKIGQQGADAVVTAAGRARNAVNSIPASRSSTITITTVRRDVRVASSVGVSANPANNALGGLYPSVRAYAGGGFGDVADGHQPELAGPGPVRVWREPETQGEAYIPLANDGRRPRARAIAAETVKLLGGVATFAQGGVTKFATGGVATAGGVTVTFPTPAVVAASVVAAEKVAVSAFNTARSYRDQQDASLALLQAQQRIEEIQKSLTERGSRRVAGRDGVDDDKRKKGMQDKYRFVGFNSLSGTARDVATAELAIAKRDLADLRNVQAEIDGLRERRTAATTTLTGQLDIFSRGAGAGGGLAATNRYIADVSEYGQTVASLKAKGASPALLQQIMAKAESGDFRSANRLGKALLAQPAALGQLNAALGVAGRVAGNVAGLTTDPRLMATGAWNPTTTVVRSENTITLGVDPSAWMTQLMTQVGHVMDTKLATLGG